MKTENLQERKIQENKPFQIKQVILQPTPFCNLRCKYCYLPDRGNRARMPTHLPCDALEYVINTGYALPQLQIRWHSGEPMSVGLKFYREAIEKLEKNLPRYHSLIHTIQTNATYITDEWCEFFKEKNFVVGISLDGPQFLNDQNRVFKNGSTTYSLVIKGLELLKKHNVKFNVIAVITSSSLNHPDEIYDFFLGLGVYYLGINIEEEEGTNQSKTLRSENFIERYKVFFNRIYERCKKERLIIREVEFIERALASPVKIKSEMAEPFYIFSVDYQGNFSTFCPELLGTSHEKYGCFSLGNIYHNHFEEVIRSKKFQQIFNDISRGVKNCEESCDYFSICGGGAPGNKLYENGSFESTETFYCKSRIQIPVDIILPEIEEKIRQSQL